MSLAGTRLGPYEIVSPLGAGGMGEVYRARDTRLGRDVAIKVLPASVAADPERLARFEREARLLASLNHPHIAQIYGLERLDGREGQEQLRVPFIVMELVEGETLDAHLKALRSRLRADVSPQPGREGFSRPLPIGEALGIARQIADALDAAHERGIVHRDLKPANIVITPEGVVKVLDFGLAKAGGAGEAGGAGADDSLTHSPTVIGPTMQGVLLGTAPYMSPEQARGKAVDKRTDIWAFGCVLYEMLTGRRAFAGETTSDTIVAILEREPDWSKLPATTPSALRQLLVRCLEKDVKRRLRDIGDARVDLDAVLARHPPRVANDGHGHHRRRAMIAVVILTLVAAAVAWRLQAPDSAPIPLAHATITRFTDFEGEELDATISPDGKFVAFLSDREGQIDAWVSQVGSGTFVNLTRGRFPALLDVVTRSLAFTGDGAHIAVRGGTVDPSGGGIKGATQLIPTIGGDPRPFLEAGSNAVWSPDGRRVAFFEGTPAGDQILIADAEGRNAKRVYQKPGHAHYEAWSPDGRFIYFVAGLRLTEADVWRVPSDGGQAERLTTHNSHIRYLAFIDNRTLLYTAPAQDGSGYWLYMTDTERRVPYRATLGVEQYTSVAASADGRRLVASVSNPRGSLWTVAMSDRVADETAVRPILLPTVRAVVPRFGPDYLVYLSSKGGDNGLWKFHRGAAIELWKASDGAVAAAAAVSPDGRRLCLPVRRSGRNVLHLMSSDGTDVLRLAEALDTRGAASWSPDGKWVTVTADDGTGLHVFKVPTDNGPAIKLVSEPSIQPVWSPDGRFIVYRQGADVKAITPDGRPVALGLPSPGFRTADPDHYRFTPDGKALVVSRGQYRQENFWRFDFGTRQLKQLTNLKPGFSVTSFDVSPDGKEIAFDRVRENSDIVLIDLPRP